jgi:hypothetical protein
MADIALSPNTQPIYPKEIIYWRKTLIAQVVPRVITTETPVLLGTVGENGAIIHNVQVIPVGDNVATVVRLYTQLVDETTYTLENEITIAATTSSNNTTALAPISATLPAILPSPQLGLHLPKECKLYCALGTAVASGLVVVVRGGNY